MEEYLLDVLLYFNGWFVFIVKFLYTRKVVVSSDPVMRVLIRKKKLNILKHTWCCASFVSLIFKFYFHLVFSTFYFCYINRNIGYLHLFYQEFTRTPLVLCYASSLFFFFSLFPFKGFQCNFNRSHFWIYAKLVERNVLLSWLACQLPSDMSTSWLRQYSLRYYHVKLQPPIFMCRTCVGPLHGICRLPLEAKK